MSFGFSVSSQGPAVVVEKEFVNEEEEERFQEQTGGKTLTGQLDIIETLTREEGQRVISGANLHGSICTHTHKTKH